MGWAVGSQLVTTGLTNAGNGTLAAIRHFLWRKPIKYIDNKEYNIQHIATEEEDDFVIITLKVPKNKG